MSAINPSLIWSFSYSGLPAIPAMLAVPGEGERDNLKQERKTGSGQMESDSHPVCDTDRQCVRQSPATVRQKSDHPETVCVTTNYQTDIRI